MQDSQSLKPFKTVRQSSETEVVIQKSRFIGRCFPVKSETEAISELEAVRKRHWDANHNCYAFRIGEAGALARSSDDGEPSGTAGMPILNALIKNDVTGVLCVVTRYFGGVLLGAGGLVRAYSGTAVQALEQAGILSMRPGTRFSLAVPYPLWQSTEHALKQHARVLETSFAEQVTVSFWIAEEDVSPVLLRLSDLSDGKLVPKAVGRELYGET